jgi:hypothetical protein
MVSTVAGRVTVVDVDVEVHLARIDGTDLGKVRRQYQPDRTLDPCALLWAYNPDARLKRQTSGEKERHGEREPQRQRT